MTSLRAYNLRATIKRPTQTTSASGAVTETPVVVALDVPCARQPITENLKRYVPGDIAVCSTFFACAVSVDLRHGDRVEVGDFVDRVEALSDAAGRGHHWEAGLVRLREDEP